MIQLVLGAGGRKAIEMPALLLTGQIITQQYDADWTGDVCRDPGQRQTAFRPRGGFIRGI